MTFSTLRTLATVGVALSLAASSPSRADTPPAAATTDEDKQKTLYALGLAVARSLDVFTLSEKEVAFVLEGVKDAVLKRKLKVDFEAFKPKVQALARRRADRLIEAEKTHAEAALAKAAAEPGAEKTSSGLVYKELKLGAGAPPSAADTVRVHYVGTLRDGTVFDSSRARGEPASFSLNRVIACWTEGVQKMKVGGQAKLTCPASIGYGERGAPPNIRPGATLTFEIELLGIDPPSKVGE